MTAAAICFVFGAWCLQQQAALPGLTGALALVPAAGLALALAGARTAQVRLLRRFVLIAFWMAAGFYWACAVGGGKLDRVLDERWEGRDLELRGVVAELPQPFDRGVRFRFDVEQAYGIGVIVPSHVDLAWYEPDEFTDLPEIRPGQRWRLGVRLKAPHGTANPGGFDLEAWALERDIGALGHVVRVPEPKLLDPMVWRPAYAVERLRERLRQRLQAALGDRALAGVIVALVVGDQRAIPPSQWQVFSRTGVNHLMSISGLHITMIASLAFALVFQGWRRTRLALRLPALRAATMAGLGVAAAYAALSGFAVPAQRTVYMLAVVAAALWAGWATRPIAVLAAAAALVTLLDPMAVTSPGFWLSFGAVAVIVLAAGGRNERPHWLRAWLRVQWAITVALVPLLLALFQQVSLVSPIANAFAIPIVSLVVVPVSLAAAILPGDWLAVVAHEVMSWCMAALEWLGSLPAAVWQQHAPANWTVVVALLGGLWLLMPRGMPARWAGVALFLPLLLDVPEDPAPGALRATVLDVGQGLAVVLRTRHHALLFDAGPAYSDVVDAGDRIVVPFLRAQGVKALDGMVVSHDDLDHSGGAASVLRSIPVQWLSSSLAPAHPLAALAPLARSCSDGERWEWDGVRFELLHPPVDGYNFGQVRDNDRSCVLKVVSAHGSLLLPADIEKQAERELVGRHGTALAADVLVVPHHGSRTSSTPAFVTAVAPRIAIVASGYRNRFGHPHPAVMALYRQAGVRMLRTDQAGAITLEFVEGGPEIREWRNVERRYWRRSAPH